MVRSKDSAAGGVCARTRWSPAEATTARTAIAIGVAKTILNFVNDLRMTFAGPYHSTQYIAPGRVGAFGSVMSSVENSMPSWLGVQNAQRSTHSSIQTLAVAGRPGFRCAASAVILGGAAQTPASRRGLGFVEVGTWDMGHRARGHRASSIPPPPTAACQADECQRC